MTQEGYHIGRADDGLTARERRCKELLKEGHSRAYVAGELGVSRQRVAQLVASLTQKGHDLTKKKTD